MSARVERECEQLDLVGQRLLEPVGQLLGAGDPDNVGELLDGLGGDGKTGEHHRLSLCASSCGRSRNGGYSPACSGDSSVAFAATSG